MCTYKGKLYALPTTPAVVALHYNKRFFYQAADKLYALGLDPTRPPRTIEEFDRYAAGARRVHPRHRTASPAPVISRWTPAGTSPCTNIWFGGGSWDRRDAKRTRCSRPENIATFEWIAELLPADGHGRISSIFKAGWARSAARRIRSSAARSRWCSRASGWGTTSRRFNAGHVAGDRAVRARAVPAARGAAVQLRMGGGGVSVGGAGERGRDVTYNVTDVLVIPRGAKHPREAFEFIAFVQRQEHDGKALRKLNGKNSPLKKHQRGLGLHASATRTSTSSTASPPAPTPARSIRRRSTPRA